jgi:hypothetical protein
MGPPGVGSCAGTCPPSHPGRTATGEARSQLREPEDGDCQGDRGDPHDTGHQTAGRSQLLSGDHGGQSHHGPQVHHAERRSGGRSWQNLPLARRPSSPRHPVRSCPDTSLTAPPQHLVREQIFTTSHHWCFCARELTILDAADVCGNRAVGSISGVHPAPTTCS